MTTSTSTRCRVSPLDYFEPETLNRAGFRLVMMVLVVGLVIAFSGCCSPVALAHAKDQRSASKGDMNDERAGPRVRRLGMANYDAWSVMEEILGGDKPDADSQARIDAAKKRAEAAAAGGDGQ